MELVRYEDMKLRSIETFTRAARFARLDGKGVCKAARFSNFEELQRQERASGFKERFARNGGDSKDLTLAWSSLEQGGRTFWTEMDSLLEMLEGILAEEVSDA